jgi:hypothetical protein
LKAKIVGYKSEIISEKKEFKRIVKKSVDLLINLEEFGLVGGLYCRRLGKK